MFKKLYSGKLFEAVKIMPLTFVNECFWHVNNDKLFRAYFQCRKHQSTASSSQRNSVATILRKVLFITKIEKLWNKAVVRTWPKWSRALRVFLFHSLCPDNYTKLSQILWLALLKSLVPNLHAVFIIEWLDFNPKMCLPLFHFLLKQWLGQQTFQILELSVWPYILITTALDQRYSYKYTHSLYFGVLDFHNVKNETYYFSITTQRMKVLNTWICNRLQIGH